jgi:hypothetical protein
VVKVLPRLLEALARHRLASIPLVPSLAGS